MANGSTSDLWRSAFPFQSHRMRLEEGSVHYLDEGPPDAPPVLFVHGNPTWSFHWRRLITALRDQHRCVAIDHLGCGLSDKPNRAFGLTNRIDHLGALIDRLDLRDVTLVAQDWGGAIGLGAMLDRQERLDRVLLFNTGAWPPDRIPWRIALCRTPLLGRIALQGGNLFSRAALRMTTSSPLTREAMAGYLAPYDSWSNRRAVYEFVADIPRGPSDSTWRTLERIEQRLPDVGQRPIRLVWGMRDWCFDETCLERFRSIWRDASDLHVNRIESAGHWVVEDAHEECLAALRSLLAGAAPQPTDQPAQRV